jgi:hypothetical protein
MYSDIRVWGHSGKRKAMAYGEAERIYLPLGFDLKAA